MDFHKKIHSDRHRPTPVFIIACFFSTVKLFCGISEKWGGIFGKKAKKTSRRQTKSFLLQQFFKNAGEVWASSPHLRSKSNCTIKENKHLKANRKNRNCLQKLRAANMKQAFRGNCGSQGKLGMCPSLAEPVSGGFPKSIVSHETMHKNCTCSNETGAMNLFSLRKQFSASGKRGVPPLLLPTSLLHLQQE